MAGKSFSFKLAKICTAFAVLFQNFSLHCSAFDIQEAELLQRELLQKSEIIGEKLNKTEKEISTAEGQIDQLNLNLATSNNKLMYLEEQKNKLGTEITLLEEKMVNVNKEVEVYFDCLKDHFKVLIEENDQGDVLFDVLFGVSSLDELSDRVETMSRLNKEVSSIIEKLNDKLEEAKTEGLHLAEKKLKLARQQQAYNDKEEEYKKLLEGKEVLLDKLNVEKKEAEGILDENDEEYRRIQRQIDDHLNSASKDAKSVIEYKGEQYLWPVPGFTRITAHFNEKRGNRFHKGIDIGSERGDDKSIRKPIHGAKVVAVARGKVILVNKSCVHDYGKAKGSCGCGGGYGNFVALDHGGGRVTLYGHLSKVEVSEGRIVAAGEVIGTVGSTGHSSGPHLHYETRMAKKHINPLSFYSKTETKKSSSPISAAKKRTTSHPQKIKSIKASTQPSTKNQKVSTKANCKGKS